MWCFTDIATREPQRISFLKGAPSWAALVEQVVRKLVNACQKGNIRLGMEQAEACPTDLRVVVQFHVGETLFDQFFNSLNGYRANFRQGWEIGLSHNEEIITALVGALAADLPSRVVARHLTARFEDCGAINVSRESIITLLEPFLSKIWFCGKLILAEGKVLPLPTGTVGPRLLLDDGTTWAAPARDESDAWLDVKGAFLGRIGLYQPKDPVVRAKRLQEAGEA
jgi:hypothetical protein